MDVKSKVVRPWRNNTVYNTLYNKLYKTHDVSHHNQPAS